MTTGQGKELVAKWSRKPDKLQKEFAVSNLLIAYGIPTTVPNDFDLAVPQPKYRAEALAFIDSAIKQSAL